MSSTRRAADIPRCRMAVPKSFSSNRYLARRLTRWMTRSTSSGSAGHGPAQAAVPHHHAGHLDAG